MVSKKEAVRNRNVKNLKYSILNLSLFNKNNNQTFVVALLKNCNNVRKSKIRKKEFIKHIAFAAGLNCNNVLYSHL